MNPSIHQEADLWATAAATGGLTDAESATWSDHIAACPACRKLNDEEVALCALIETRLAAEAPDAGFERRIIDVVEVARSRERYSWHGFSLFQPALLAAAASIALIAVVGIVWVNHVRQPTPASVAAAAPTQPALGEVPAPVRTAIQSQANGATVTGIEKDTDDGEVSYTIDTKGADGSQSTFAIASDGALISKGESLSSLPPPVRSAIAAQADQGTIDAVEEDFDDAQPAYVATITSPQGRDHDFTFSTDGTLLDIETNLDELPSPLQAAIKAQAGTGSIDDIDKSFDDGETSYVATIATPDGKERDYTFNPDGSLSSIEVTLPELPPSLQTAIKAQVGNDTLQSIDKTFDDGEITYDAAVTTPDGRERDFSLSDQGALVSREVAIADAPAAVQRTITQTLGTGKVIEIDQAFDIPSNGVPYEIEGSKNGKPFYFLVSPTGSFLGMED
jgi:uncharacterized membrane protein YkoI